MSNEELREAIRGAVDLFPGSLREIARRAEVDPSHVARILRGEREATVNVARRLMQVLQETAAESGRAAEILRRTLKD